MHGGDDALSPPPPPATAAAMPFKQFASPASVAPAAAAAVASVSEAVQSNWVVLLVVAGVAVLGLLLWWIVKKTMTKTYGEQATVSLIGTPATADVTRKFAMPKMPAEVNGQRLTMSFWMYVSDFSKNDGAYRHVMHIGQEDVSSASPLVFLDRTKNRLIVWFARTDRAPATPLGTMLRSSNAKLNPTSTLPDSATNPTFDVNKHGIVIPYIPQQRWVHVAVVVDETVQATTITGYLDGEVVVQSTTGEAADDANGYPVVAGANQYATATADSTSSKDFRMLNLSLSQGPLVTGGDVFSRGGIGFPGYVSRATFYNYELNAKDVLNLYHQGPYAMPWLQRLGYGVRAPVYKLAPDS